MTSWPWHIDRQMNGPNLPGQNETQIYMKPWIIKDKVLEISGEHLNGGFMNCLTIKEKVIKFLSNAKNNSRQIRKLNMKYQLENF